MATLPSFDSGRVARVHSQPEDGVEFDYAVVHFMMAGTVTVEDTAGTALDYDVVQGQTLPFLCKKVTIVSDITIDKIRCWR